MIKNYTTEIPAERTIAEIHTLLAQNGARGIATEYTKDGLIENVYFKIPVGGKELAFRLPAKPELVYKNLFANMQYEERLRKQRTKKAQNIAWRICKTWLEAQIAPINLEQANIEEVFVPYLIMPDTDNKSLYETLKEKQFALPKGA
jgi:hypothetical protein